MSYQTLVQSDRIAFATQQGNTVTQVGIITTDSVRSTIFFGPSNLINLDGSVDPTKSALTIDLYNKTLKLGDSYITGGNTVADYTGDNAVIRLASTSVGASIESQRVNYLLISTIAAGAASVTLLRGVQNSISSVVLYASNTSNWASGLAVDWSTSVSSVAEFTSNSSNYFIANAGGTGTSSLLGVISSGFSTLSLFTSNTSNYARGIAVDWSTPLSTVALYTSNTSNWASNIQQNWSSAVSIATLYTSNTSNWTKNAHQDWSTPVSTVSLFTSNTSNYARGISVDWSTPLSTVAHFTSNTSNWTKNAHQDWSTTVSSVAQFTSNASNYFMANAGGTGTSSLLGVISSGFSTLALLTSNTSNYFLPALSNNYSTNLQSTLDGLGTAGYISTGQFLSSMHGMTSNISSMIDPVELASSVVGLGTVGFVSSIGLTTIMNSTVRGVNEYVSSMIDPQELTSTITGLGTAGFISTIGLDAKFGSTLTGVNTTISGISTQTGNVLQYSRGFLQDISTPISSLSTLYGTRITSLSAAISTLTLQNFTSLQGSVSSLQVNALTIGTGTGIVSLGDINTVSISSISTTSGAFHGTTAIIQQVVASSFRGDGSQIQNVAGLSTVFNYARNILQDWSTPVNVLSLYATNTSNWAKNAQQDWSTPVSSVSLFTSNTSNYAKGILQDYSTALSVAALFTSNTSNWTKNTHQDWSTPVSSVALYTSNTSNWASNIQQNWSSAVSIATLFTSNTSNYARGFIQDFSTPVSTVFFYARNILQDFSTPVSSVSLFTSNTSNYARGFIQDFSTPVSTVFFYARNILQDFSTPVSTVFFYSRNLLQDYSTPVSTVFFYSRNLLQDFSTPVSTVSLFTSNTSNYFLPALSNNYSTNLRSTLDGLGTAGYISTAHLLSSMHGMTSNISSMIDPVEITSSIVGLGTIGFVSSIGLTTILNSTVRGVNEYVSSMIDPVELTSTVIGLGTTGFVSSIGFDAKLASTTNGLGTIGYISSSQLISTQNLILGVVSSGQSSVALFTSNTSNYARGILVDWSTPLSVVSLFATNTSNYSRNILQDFSTPVSSVSLFTSNTSNYARGFLQDFSTPVSSISTVSGATSNWSRNLLQDISTPVSSLSTIYGIRLTSLSVTVSSLTLQNFTSLQGSVSSLQVNSLLIGAGTGSINLGDTVMTAISSVSTTTNTLYALNTLLGNVSSQTAIQFYGITGQYTNTAIAERLISPGIQELLLYKASTISDQIRLQTTGNIVFEAGVAARGWSTSTAAATPTLYISYLSNVGIGTASPAAMLDVAGTSRFQSISTLQAVASSFRGDASQLQNVAGLSTVFLYSRGFLQDFSTPVSSVSLFTSNTSNYARGFLQDFSTPVSSVSLFTSNTSNYARGFLQDFSTPVSSISTVTGLTSNYATGILVDWSTPLVFLSSIYGTRLTSLSASISSLTLQNFNSPQGYISSLVVDSFVIGSNSGFIDMGDIITTSHSSLIINTGLFTASGAVCTPQIIVSSINGAIPLVAANITSTIQGLATFGYISTSQLTSTVHGLTSNISSMIDPVELASSIVGLGTVGFVSSIGLTTIMNSTVRGVNEYVSSMIDPLELASSIVGLGTIGFTSTLGLDSKLASTFQSLATGGYISSSQLFSTVTALTGSTLSLSTGAVFASSIQALRISTAQTAVCTITFNDQRPGNALGNVYQYSSILYYNSFVVAGTSAMNIQSFTF